MKKSKLFITIITILLVFPLISAQDNERKATNKTEFNEVALGSIKVEGNVRFFSTFKKSGLEHKIDYELNVNTHSIDIQVAAAKINGVNLKKNYQNVTFGGDQIIGHPPQKITLKLGVRKGNKKISRLIWITACSIKVSTYIKKFQLPLPGTKIPCNPEFTLGDNIKFQWTYSGRQFADIHSYLIGDISWSRDINNTNHVIIPGGLFKNNQNVHFAVVIKGENKFNITRYLSTDSNVIFSNRAFLPLKTSKCMIEYK